MKNIAKIILLAMVVVSVGSMIADYDKDNTAAQEMSLHKGYKAAQDFVKDKQSGTPQEIGLRNILNRFLSSGDSEAAAGVIEYTWESKINGTEFNQFMLEHGDSYIKEAWNIINTNDASDEDLDKVFAISVIIRNASKNADVQIATDDVMENDKSARFEIEADKIKKQFFKAKEKRENFKLSIKELIEKYKTIPNDVKGTQLGGVIGKRISGKGIYTRRNAQEAAALFFKDLETTISISNSYNRTIAAIQQAIIRIYNFYTKRAASLPYDFDKEVSPQTYRDWVDFITELKKLVPGVGLSKIKKRRLVKTAQETNVEEETSKSNIAEINSVPVEINPVPIETGNTEAEQAEIKVIESPATPTLVVTNPIPEAQEKVIDNQKTVIDTIEPAKVTQETDKLKNIKEPASTTEQKEVLENSNSMIEKLKSLGRAVIKKLKSLDRTAEAKQLDKDLQLVAAQVAKVDLKKKAEKVAMQATKNMQATSFKP